MSLDLLFGLGAPLAAVLVIAKWVLRYLRPPGQCGCGHAFAFHDLADGKCGGQAKWRKASWDNWKFGPCGCKQFTGSMA